MRLCRWWSVYLYKMLRRISEVDVILCSLKNQRFQKWLNIFEPLRFFKLLRKFKNIAKAIDKAVFFIHQRWILIYLILFISLNGLNATNNMLFPPFCTCLLFWGSVNSLFFSLSLKNKMCGIQHFNRIMQSSFINSALL